jgi:rhodanese-related sulfurtransferase/uncharacterized membrane protein YedE/YeeE
MAPFIPQGFINPDLNLFFAFILGLGFGYILEQAGFSSARKLAGVFYGYDFVVLRVFFTAGITAMTGMVLFSYLGWVDMSLVFINPTFLWSAIIGGVIMGFGFIMGGFCPGTSVVAAVIGKIDGMVFLAAMFLGIFIFGHFYEAFLPVYSGYYLGSPFIYETLGISRDWFAFILVFVALMAFVVTQLIEDRINRVLPAELAGRPNFKIPAFMILSLVLLNLFLPENRISNLRETGFNSLLEESVAQQKYISLQEAAYHLLGNDRNIVFIDTRSREDFRNFSLPGAINMPAEEILAPQYRNFFRDDKRRKVFYSFGESQAAIAWMAAYRAGHNDLFILQDGLNGFFTGIFKEDFDNYNDYDNQQEFNKRFILKARQIFQEGIQTKVPDPAVPEFKTVEIKPAAGGC